MTGLGTKAYVLTVVMTLSTGSPPTQLLTDNSMHAAAACGMCISILLLLECSIHTEKPK